MQNIDLQKQKLHNFMHWILIITEEPHIGSSSSQNKFSQKNYVKSILSVYATVTLCKKQANYEC